ncbi:MAG: dGTP triphosphohydrolase [Ignavibacteriaceae bacterium]
MDWNNLLNDSRLRESTRKKDMRNEFESDLGRLIFSPAIRRMHDKTQVFPLSTDDNIHTRLTHSLEVQSLAYSIGLRLCEKEEFVNKFTQDNQKKLYRTVPVILSCIGLAHDIGNPPFGHYGEQVLGNYFQDLFKNNIVIKKDDINKLTEEENNQVLKRQKLLINLDKDEQKDFTRFNGNVQGFRVLTKLQVKQDIYGLNLTFGVLSAFLKYPQLATEIQTTKDYRNTLGIYQSERNFYEIIRKNINIDSYKNPLAFLLESADSICYHSMDIEDGFNKGYYKVSDILEFIKSYTDDTVKNKILEFEIYLKEKINPKINYERTKMVELRLFIINNLLDEIIENFLIHMKEIDRGEYYGELIYENKHGLGKALKVFEIEKIFNQREVESMELTGKSVIEGLLNHFVFVFLNHKKEDDEFKTEANKLFDLISNSMRTVIEIETTQKEIYKLNDYYKLRLIVDYISGMTDQFALKLYQKLQGIRIS